ncbi:MAG: dihydrodipicolinate synthase family protein [Geminicoccaceae bacterium]|nr:dihydrodipicolinate synthase family protein [Geminicoccaceae bacterium]MCX8101509.1 dihydrodipicolinate synthase family protein [Geminicoccaceae bacterium]MDW8370962.1 dihydrodipicolinate synthase family protein [Geminicoccaceae bacterium]
MEDPRLRGIWAAIVTAVDPDGEINLERWARHARWLLRQGCHGIGLFGTTGETQAFSVAERQAALEALLASGLPPERVILGVGCCARADTVALVRHGLGLGITRMLALPPFFYKNVPEEGLVRAFSEVIEKVADPRLELLLYHFPQVAGVPIPKPVIARLLERYPATVKGVKDSSADLAHTLDLIRSFPNLAVFAGADQHLLEVLQAGGAGTISAAANLNCAASRAVFEAFERDDAAAAEAGMRKVVAVREALQKRPLIPAIKHVIADGRHDPVWRTVRPPLVELDAAEGERLLAELDAAGYAYDPDLYSVAAA